MDYKEALKRVQTKQAKQNFMVIEMGYDNSIVLPYSDGLTFMAALEKAETLTEGYSKPKAIVGMERGKIKSTLMPHSEYEQIKIAALLNITIAEVQEHGLQAA